MGNKWFVVVDGEEQKQYDSIGDTLIFSPDAKRLAYAAQEGNKWFVIVDGQECTKYDGVSSITFSPDSKRVAYGAGMGEKNLVVIDGKESKLYDGMIRGSKIVFDSPDMLHYLVLKDTSVYLVEETIK